MSNPNNHKNLSAAMVTTFAICCGVIVANIYYSQPIIEMMASDTGLSLESASMIVSLTQIGYALGLLFLVPLSDLFENKKLTLVSLSLASLSLLFTAISSSPSSLLFASLCVGISSISVQILIPLATHLTPESKRGAVVGNIMGGLLAGILLARPVSSFIADHFGWRVVFVSAAIMMIIIGLFIMIRVPEHRPKNKPKYSELLLSLWHLIKAHPVLRKRSLIQALLFACFSLYWTVVPLELSLNYGFSHTQIALFALVGAIGAIAAPISGRLADMGFAKQASSAAIFLALLSFTPALLWRDSNVIGLAITGIILDFAVQMSMVLGQRDVYLLAPHSRGRMNAIYMTSIFIGGAVGSAVAGEIYSLGGWIYIAIIGCVVPSLIIGMRLSRKYLK